jgi:hypothetical protein
VGGLQVDAEMARSLLASRGGGTSALDARRLPLPTLPHGVRLTSVVPAVDGLELGFDLAGGPVTGAGGRTTG